MNPAAPLRDVVRGLLRRGDDVPALPGLVEAVAIEVASHGTEELPDRIAAEIHEALLNINRISLIVTGLGWLGGGIRAIENALLDLIGGAERELVLAVYTMSPGPAPLWRAMERAIDGGIRCTLIVDRLNEQNAEMKEWVRLLSDRHSDTLHVADFRGEDGNDHLHAKIVVADRRKAIVGSANLTAHGLLLAHELAVMVEGPAAEEIAGRLDLLARSRLVTRLS
jgi:phosphatidylserine/phosphatidylglycerophosphate/cardiolipin synthase-like enzyme